MSHANSRFPVPANTRTVGVRIIDSTSSIENLQLELLMKPPVDGLEYLPPLPSWSFLIEHPSGKKVLYDLGVAKNWRSFPPAAAGHIDELGWVVKIEKEVIDVLSENGICPEEIDAIVWRLVSCLFVEGGCLIQSLVTGIGTILVIHRGSRLVQIWWLVLGSRMLFCQGIRRSKTRQFDNLIWREYAKSSNRACAADTEQWTLIERD